VKDEAEKIRPLWADLHCHLDLYPDHAALIAECDREKVATLAVTTTPKAWSRNHALATHSSMVRAGLGLHPQLAEERADELALFEKLLPQARYVGEIGLDAGPKFYKSFDVQQRVFSRILRACSEHGNKILSIHSIRSAARVLDALEANLPPERGKAILHWFTGTPAEAKRAIEYGCYLSINPKMLQNPRHRTLVAALPSDRLLTETDGPFVKCGPRPIRPRDVSTVVNQLAAARDVKPADMAAIVVRNLRNLVLERSDR
jgi:TatD DNase family protein